MRWISLVAGAVFLVSILPGAALQADTIDVPLGGDIQAAIDGASGGDTIQIAAGTFPITSTIDPGGKAVTILGAVDGDGAPTTVLDGGGSVRVLICQNGETEETVFENLVIQNGSSSSGGGMRNQSSSPTLMNCTFTGKTAGNGGGGVSNLDSNPILIGCTFSGNSTNGAGGGMNNYFGNPILTNCSFTGNTATWVGGGMHNWASSPTLTGCVFQQNSCDLRGGGMSNETYETFDSDPSEPILTNCTFTDNAAAESGGDVYSWGDSRVFLDGTAICGNTVDGTATDENQVEGDFTETGVNCITAECTDADYDGLPDCGTPCVGDINGDGEVDGADMAYVLGYRGTDEALPDLDDDGLVDAADLGLVVAAWGSCP